MTWALAAVLLASSAWAQAGSEEFEKAFQPKQEWVGKVYRDRVDPNWLPNGGLWYRVQTGASTQEFVLVSPEGKVRRFASFAEMKKGAGSDLPEELPLGLTRTPEPKEAGERVDLVFENTTTGEVTLYWVNGRERVRYASVAAGAKYTQSTFAGHAWEVREASDRVLGYVTAPLTGGRVKVGPASASPGQPRPRNPWISPDGKLRAQVEGDQLKIAVVATSEVLMASTDGSPTDSYQGTMFWWSPDSSKLVVFRSEPAQERKVHIVSSSPRDQLQPKLVTLDYLKPGDKIARPRPVIFDVAAKKQRMLDDALTPNPWSLTALGDSPWANGVTWLPDSKRFLFAYNQRGHQLMRVVSVDASTGQAKSLFEDASPTFIHYSGKYFARVLPGSKELLWMSERSGWNHLYIHDLETGKEKRAVTSGAWVVRSVEDIEGDEATLQVMGRAEGQDPYHGHFVRVNLRTGRTLNLTEGDGSHRLIWNPDKSRYLAIYSRVDLPSVVEYRRASDGRKLGELERADASALFAAGWNPPKRFTAKGRDGKTDIFGIIHRPPQFDPARKYPVIEQIYAGPQGFFVPKTWRTRYGAAEELANLGFIVVQIDGMGTDGRGKAFHDVAFKNLKDAGYPDRIAWMKALAASDPSLDLTRVGVYGGSAGGQNAMAALLWHGDFYKAAAADCGCHDNRMDKIWWNEQWMSYPVDKSYEESSNMVNAARLSGRLLLTVGELDSNVDPASTMQVADALIRAGKVFDLIVFPGGGHGAGESLYGRKRRAEFFLRHLVP
jgi:dipeptidyl aminopeptidase/acylaminoacyl peptidase